jgi:hypothetical protein
MEFALHDDDDELSQDEEDLIAQTKLVEAEKAKFSKAVEATAKPNLGSKRTFPDVITLEPAFLDIETTNLKANFGRILCASVADMHGNVRTFRIDEEPFKRPKRRDDSALAAGLRDYIEQFDFIVTWYGKMFDLPYIDTRLLIANDRPVRKDIMHSDPIYKAGHGSLALHSRRLDAVAKTFRLPVQKTGLDIKDRHRVESIEQNSYQPGSNQNSPLFTVKTATEDYRCRSVLLAIGRRGTPRKLGVPGEEQSKVVYRLIDPQQYVDHHVLVVGGGDSALEAAVSIAEQPGTDVTLSYRSEAFSRAKEKNRIKVADAEKQGRLRVIMQSNVKHIGEDKVSITTVDDEDVVLDNDAVIVCAGGILPTAFLKDTGINVDTKFGTA